MPTSIVWYKNKNDWDAMKAIAADPDIWEETFEEWLDDAEQGIKGLQDQGIYCKKVTFKIDGFKAWCDEGDRPYDATSRSQYVIYVAEAGEYR
jgi:hypothetical protein